MRNREQAQAILARMEGGEGAERAYRLRQARLSLGHPVHDTVRIEGPITLTSGPRMVRAIRACRGCSSLHLRIDSPGGDLILAKQIIAEIDSVCGKKIPVSAHAERDCSSAAVPIFLRADQRTAEQNTRFILHRAALPDEAIKRLTAEQLRRAADYMDKIDAAGLRALEERLGRHLPADIRKRINDGEDVTLSTRLALAIGLVEALL